MRPILFDSSAADFTSHGLGTLADAVSCKAAAEENGTPQLTLQYPVSGIHADLIRDGCILLARPDPYKDPQPYRIHRHTKPIKGLVTWYARHLSYDAAGIPVAPYDAYSAAEAINKLQSQALLSSPFTYTTDLEAEAAISFGEPVLQRAALTSIVETYGGFLDFDGYHVSLLASLGEDRGTVIRYGVDLTDATQESNISEVYTGILPYCKPTDGDAVLGHVLQAPGTYDFVRILPVELSDAFEEVPTVSELDTAGETWLEEHDIGKPAVNLKVSYADLGQDVRLHDTVGVRFERQGIVSKARVIKVTYDVLEERYDSVELGDHRTSIVDTIAGARKKLTRTPTTSAMQEAILTMTAVILGAKGGAIRFLDTDDDGMLDTLYVGNNADPAQADKVWRFNYEGLGASTNGFDGPFVLGMTFENGGTINCRNINVVNINGRNIESQSIGGGSIAGGAIGTSHLANGAVTEDKTDFSGYFHGRKRFSLIDVAEIYLNGQLFVDHNGNIITPN